MKLRSRVLITAAIVIAIISVSIWAESAFKNDKTPIRPIIAPKPNTTTIRLHVSTSNNIVPRAIFSVPLNVINRQSSPIPDNFQLMVQLDAASYSAYEDSNMQNVYFSYSNGTTIPSWLEGNASNESNPNNLNKSIRLIYWLRIASHNFLPANSSNLIYMDFGNKSASFFGNYTVGEAPQLSPIFGEYDNGKEVFLDYQQFGSFKSLPSSWRSEGLSFQFDKNSLNFRNNNGSYGALFQSDQSQGNYIYDILAYGQITYGITSNISNPLLNSYRMVDQNAECGSKGNICLSIEGKEVKPALSATIFSQGSSGLIPIYNSYYSSTYKEGILIDDIWNKTLFDNFKEPYVKAILGDNYSVIATTELNISKQYQFNSRDYIIYDLEKWSKTPISEQQNVSTYVAKICNSIHQFGYKCGFTPEIDSGGTQIRDQFLQVTWDDVDLLNIQAQAFTNNGTVLSNAVNSILKDSLAYNPNLNVYVQLDMNTSLSVLESQITNISHIPGIKGIQLTYLPVTGACSIRNCNPQNLQAVLGYIQNQSMTELISNDSAQVYSLDDISNSDTTLYYNYNYIQFSNSTSTHASSYFGFFLLRGQQSDIYWYRERAVPPNNIMPTVVFSN